MFDPDSELRLRRTRSPTLFLLQPPDLEILEIGDLSKDRFRGIFRLTYSGDAHIVLATKVQANPLSKPSSSPAANGTSNSLDGETFAPFSTASATRGILFAAAPLIVPMKLRLSHVRLRAIIVLVVSKTKGITLVFKNDPLESVQVSSTFDSVAVIAKYLQQEIEAQLKEVFREDLPGIIHRLSQGWLNGQRPSASKTRGKKSSGGDGENTANNANSAKSKGKEKGSIDQAVSSSPSRKPKHSLPTPSATESRRKSTSKVGPRSPDSRSKVSTSARQHKSADPDYLPPLPIPSRQQSFERDESAEEIHIPFSTSFEDIEAHDPTYGLRPDEVRLPKKGHGFRGLKNLRRGISVPGGLGAGGGAFSGFGLGGLLQEEAGADQGLLQVHQAPPRSAQGNEDDSGEKSDVNSEWASEDGIAVSTRRREADEDELDNQMSSGSSSRSRSRSGSSVASSSSSRSSRSPSRKATGSKARKADTVPSTLDFVDPFNEYFSDITRLDYTEPAATSTSPQRTRERKSSSRPKKASSAVGTMSVDRKGKHKAVEGEKGHRGQAFLRTMQSASGLASLNGLDSSSISSPVGLSRTPSSSVGGGSSGARIVQQHQRLAAREGALSRDTASDSGRRGRKTARPVADRQISTSSLASAASSSGGLMSRPRMFHTSSLIRPPEFAEGGSSTVDDYNGSSVAGSNYGYGRYLTARGAGSSTIGRSESGGVGGGSSSTVIGGAGGGGSGSAPMSAVGSSRTFTIGGKKGGSVSASARSNASASDRGRSTDRDRPRDYFSGLRHSETPNDDVDSEPDESQEEDAEDLASEARDAFPNGDTSSSSHRNSESSGTHSQGGRTRFSKAGTLATLEPEPMSESGSAYKRDVWKETHSKGKGFYRPGWERASSTGGAAARR